MKIDPALPPAAGMQAAPPGGAGPDQPFEAFLDGGAPGRAFGFTEFGMFGREGQTQSPAPAAEPGPPPAQSDGPPIPVAGIFEPAGLPQALPAGPQAGSGKPAVPIESLDESADRPPAQVRAAQPGQPPAEPDRLVLPVESLDEPAGRPPKHTTPLATPAPEPGQRPAYVRPTAEARPRVSAAPIAAGDAGQALPSPEPGAGEEAGPAQARHIPLPPPPRSDVSLILSEKGGAVALVAAGPALDPQSCALLRRLARAILARSGLDLAQFHLNGVALAPDSTIMIGGSHGTRSS